MVVWLIAILCREIMLQAESDIGASGAAKIADSAIARGRADIGIWIPIVADVFRGIVRNVWQG